MGTREETSRAQEQANDQPFPPPRSRNKREKKQRETENGDHHYDLPPCGGDAPGLGRIGAKEALPEEGPGGPSGGFVRVPSNGAAKRDGEGDERDGDERDGRRRGRERHHRFEIGGCYDIT